MGLDLKELSRTFNKTDTIVSIPYTRWLLQHGDDPLSIEVAGLIFQLLTTPPRNRSASFSASSAGACDRRQVLSYLGMPAGVVDAQLQNIFNDGKWRHLRWQAHLLMANILVDIEDPLIWPNMRSVGTMDGSGVVSDDHPRQAWRGKDFGFELKGMSTFQFVKYTGLSAPEKHLDQIARYFLSSGYPLFVLMCEDKTTQAFHEWVIESTSPDMARRIDEQSKELVRLNAAVNHKSLPPPLPDCAAQRGTVFNECPYGGKGGVCVKSGMWPRIR